MEERNYKEFDYQTILIKKQKVEQVVDNYKNFGWEVIRTTQDPQYENILEVEFKRNHFIKSKDRLQFLQVNMEVDTNKRGRLERTKHSKTLIGALSGGVLGAGLVALSVLSFMNMPFVLAVVFGTLFALFACCVCVACPILLTRNFKKEKIDFAVKCEELDKNILSCCIQAKKLLGAKDGQ